MRPRLVAVLAVLAAACAAIPVARRSGYHPSDADFGLTRIAHGSLLVEMRGTRLLVDPWFHSGFVVRQTEPLGLTPETLPPVGAVLLTHGHGDHFDARALRDLAGRVPEAIAPGALHERLVDLGFARVTDLGWWERTRVGAIEITAVPARHAVPENGYLLEAGGVQAYLAGDTRPFPELVDVATRAPELDVAVLPVGGERLLGVPRAMGPEAAARAAATLGARRIIPVNYGRTGGFPVRWHARRPVERFRRACARLGITRERIVVLDTGESWHYWR